MVGRLLCSVMDEAANVDLVMRMRVKALNHVNISK